MSAVKGKILIESILGGQSPMTFFAGSDQFKASLGIDPGLPAVDNTDDLFRESGIAASGLIRPAPYIDLVGLSDTTMAGSPMWFVQNPKNEFTYVYDSVGSVYAIGAAYYDDFAALADLTDVIPSTGNGAEYYDNYIYFSRASTIARYGPLDGTPSWQKDYWVTTLSKAGLSNTTYPIVEVGATGKYSLDLSSGSLQYAYITGANQTNLGITSDLTIEMWVNFRSLPNSSNMGGTYLST